MDSYSEDELYAKLKKTMSIINSKDFSGGPSLNNEQKLYFYGLYKVIEEGKFKGKVPSKLTNPVGHYKAKAWKGMSKYDRRECLVKFLDRVKEIHPKLAAKL